MRTIGRRVPKDRPRGDYTCMCSYCGVMWYRSKLRKDRAGNLACPNEGSGRDAVTLSDLNAAAATECRGAGVEETTQRDGAEDLTGEADPLGPFIPGKGQYP